MWFLCVFLCVCCCCFLGWGFSMNYILPKGKPITIALDIKTDLTYKCSTDTLINTLDEGRWLLTNMPMENPQNCIINILIRLKRHYIKCGHISYSFWLTLETCHNCRHTFWSCSDPQIRLAFQLPPDRITRSTDHPCLCWWGGQLFAKCLSFSNYTVIDL